MCIRFSLVIPAYNEARRLPPYLLLIRPHLDRVFGQRYEVLVVDDGSQDGLSETVQAHASSWPQLTLLQNHPNLGKGAAVKRGMLSAHGSLVLFADADGATPIEEEVKLRRAIFRGADLAVGSRLNSLDGSPRFRLWYRALAGNVFAWLARIMLPVRVRDPQCGFKMFRRQAAAQLFGLSREPGYAFDLEILAFAHALRYRIAEVPVSWREVPGSKVRLLRDGPSMLRRALALRRILHALPPSPTPAAVRTARFSPLPLP